MRDTYNRLDENGLLYLLQQIYIDINAAAASGTSVTIDSSISASSTNTNVAGSKAVYDFVVAALANITSFSSLVVESLPATGQTNILYLVAKASTETGNVYDEYLYINSVYELIGTTAMDLSGYVQTSQMHALTNVEIASIITAAKG